jgi:cephalosporin hydroxylase
MTLKQYFASQYGLMMRLIGHKAGPAPKELETVDAFHKLYYDAALTGGTWHNTHWCGVRVLKFPPDLWIYQEIIWEVKPDLIVETGTFDGGSALYMAMLCDHLGTGKIVTIDINDSPARPKHPRITYIRGSSVDPEIVSRVKKMAGSGRVLIILDSDHSQKHVSAELASYWDMVPIGSYLIVEDTNVNGHPVGIEHGPGPYEAVQEFIKSNNSFLVDRSKEKFLATWNPSGFLKRVR